MIVSIFSMNTVAIAASGNDHNKSSQHGSQNNHDPKKGGHKSSGGNHEGSSGGGFNISSHSNNHGSNHGNSGHHNNQGSGTDGNGLLDNVIFGKPDFPVPSGSDFYDVPAAVPEPETYVMLLAGLGLIGFMIKRGKEST